MINVPVHRFEVHYWLEQKSRNGLGDLSKVSIGKAGDETSRNFFSTPLGASGDALLCLICGPPGFNSAAKA